MTNIIIVDRQPLLRLGLRLLIGENFNCFSLFEAKTVEELISRSDDTGISIIILGFDSTSDNVNHIAYDSLREKFPQSSIILYADDLSQWKVITYFKHGVAAFLSKRAHEKEIVCCLQCVLQGNKYVSSQKLHGLIGNLTMSTN